MNISGNGLDSIIKAFEQAADNLGDTCDKAMYKAAGRIADEVKAGLQGLPVHDNERTGHRIRGVTADQKADLIASMGIASFRKNDEYVETSIGFAGYGSTPTKKYPDGIPNRLLMRSVESGNSFRQKTPVVRPALNRVKKEAAEILKNEVTEQLKKEI